MVGAGHLHAAGAQCQRIAERMFRSHQTEGTACAKSLDRGGVGVGAKHLPAMNLAMQRSAGQMLRPYVRVARFPMTLHKPSPRRGVHFNMGADLDVV